MPDTYTTISGDTWDGIALEVYGSEAEADWLMQHNPQYITTTKFASSIVLQTPGGAGDCAGKSAALEARRLI